MGMQINIEDLGVKELAGKLAKDNDLPLSVVLSQAEELEKATKGESLNVSDALNHAVKAVKDVVGKYIPPPAPGAVKPEKEREKNEQERDASEEKTSDNGQRLQVLLRAGGSSPDYSR